MPVALESKQAEIADALRTVAINSAYNASRALSKWFKRGVRLTSDGFATMPIADVAGCAGSPDAAVVAAHLRLEGDLTGDVLLVFPEMAALRLVDLMIGASEGTSKAIGELEASCIQETGNIVGSSFTNCIANWLRIGCIPAAPTVVHDLACAVIEPLLIGQATNGDEALVSTTEFELDGRQMEWYFLFLPSAESMKIMRSRSSEEELRKNALHTIAINGAFDASRAMSKWLHRGVKLTTEGFERIPLSRIYDPDRASDSVVALHLELSSQLHGHSLMVMSRTTASELVDILMHQPPGTTCTLDEMGRSCLQETGNIISSSFINSWAKWLEISSEPQPPQIYEDMLGPIMQSVIVEQAQVSDEVFLARTSFTVDGRWLDWEFYLLPTPSSLRLIEMSLS
ncbi:MAG: chemotaxis protein CheC [Phycisphaerae bacterium]|nr:chemotaxis protein CheC [Phycisphaerae bacterium]